MQHVKEEKNAYRVLMGKIERKKTRPREKI